MRHLLIGLAAALVIGGCSAAEPQTTNVELRTFNFKPGDITISVGDTVTWLNQDRIHHTVTAGIPDVETALFDFDLFDQGESASFTFDESGEYQYFCVIHPHMQGVVEVVDS